MRVNVKLKLKGEDLKVLRNKQDTDINYYYYRFIDDELFMTHHARFIVERVYEYKSNWEVIEIKDNPLS